MALNNYNNKVYIYINIKQERNTRVSHVSPANTFKIDFALL
jgi:hypothetical protein